MQIMKALILWSLLQSTLGIFKWKQQHDVVHKAYYKTKNVPMKNSDFTKSHTEKSCCY